MVDTSHSPALEIVARRDATTLLPIIQAHVASGTIVHSDEWRAYRRIPSLAQVAAHATVNHSVSFVDPVTGTHTQHVESYWNTANLKLKRMKGCHTHQIPSYLDEFMWRERFGTTNSVVWVSILRDIAQQYPV